MATLKEKFENENAIVILDTNVLLGLYRHSPQWSDFGIKCLGAISNYIVLPYIVKMEYEKHYQAFFANLKERTSKYDEQLVKCIDTFKEKSLNACNEIEKLHFPNVSVIRNCINEGFLSIKNALEEHTKSQEALDVINRVQSENDSVFALFESIKSANRIMDELSVETIYRFCDEGEDRYRKEIPPGFEDAKKKSGIRKYSDYIIWREIIQYAQTKGVDVIVVTDDTKSDWWETVDGAKKFHSKLIIEFERKTQKNIDAISSAEFYRLLARLYKIPEYNVTETALSITAQSYGIAIGDDVFEKVMDSFCDNIEHYIVEYDSVSMSDGFEIDDGSLEFSFLSAEYLNGDEYGHNYLFKYRVRIMAESHDYWGRDDDTKEVLLSPANWHTFEGVVEIEVVRELSDDELPYEVAFESAGIISGDLEQTDYKSHSFKDDYYDDEEQKGYNWCPKCGKPITFETDALNGFCVNCPD